MDPRSTFEDGMPLKLMRLILDAVVESGATQEEATAAIKAAEAMLPELGLSSKTHVVIRSR